jgi:hypothetical protein
VLFHRATFIKNVDFKGATFTQAADFSAATFTQEADFNDTTFTQAAEFNYATFGESARFSRAKFHETVVFSYVKFNKWARFKNATFTQAADFSATTFTLEADFSGTTFIKTVEFSYATFKDYVKFKNTIFKRTSSLRFQPFHIECPNRIIFHTVTLRPFWFINTNASNFEFTNIEWTSRFDNKSIDVNSELEELKKDGIKSPHRQLARTCRQLAVNAEENNLYEEASDFRFMAMNAQRLEPNRGLPIFKLRSWYYFASGYGEQITRAALVLLGVLLAFAVMYTWVGFEVKKSEPVKIILAVKNPQDQETPPEIIIVPNEEKELPATPNKEIGKPLTLYDAIFHSISVAALQRPEPKPQTTAAKALVTLETILGPLQAALLALAIRRKFMR